mgnify:CR=1 FL=1
MTKADITKYLATIGAKGGQAGKGKAKARSHTRAALKRYWRKVKAGKIERKGYQP